MRRVLVILATLPLLALTLGTSTASAAPARPAVAFHATRAATIVDVYNVRTFCWAPDPVNTGLVWKNGNPGVAYTFNLPPAFFSCTNQGSEYFVVGPCAPPPDQGYCQLQEVQYNQIYWSTDGNCFGYSYSLNRVVQQPCTNASYQGWAGTGGSPDLIWNEWLQAYHPAICAVPGGYTQQVITADTGDNSPLYLSCPQGAGGQSYLGKQQWYVEQGN